MITNKFNFDELLEKILSAQYYDGVYKPKRFSTTEILQHPKKIWLERRHMKANDDIERDITSLNWTTFGSLVHQAVETIDLPFVIKEQRLRHKFKLDDETELELSGAFDLYQLKKKRLVDYKFTSAWSLYYMSSIKKYYKQLLLYALLLSYEGFRVEEVNNVLLFRNWEKRDYKRNGENGYPPTPFLRLSYRINEKHLNKIYNFLIRRLKFIWKYNDVEDDNIPKCEDRWSNNKLCKEYCPVNKFCHYGKKYVGKNNITKENYNDYKLELKDKLKSIENDFLKEV